MDQDTDKNLKMIAVGAIAVLIISNAVARGDESFVGKGVASVASIFQTQPESYLVARKRKGVESELPARNNLKPSPVVEESGLEIHELYSGVEVKERRTANIFLETWRILVGSSN
jgi:hypothetical protein